MNAPRPVCFMIMPYGTKKTDAPAGQGIAEINFDALWDKALRPAIEALGYEPVRADQDVGALIIHEMLERLYFSDLVLADMTIPNGNVYYEVGVRHACQSSGCVLMAADWSRQLFDVAQMRTIRYPLTATTIDEATAQLIRAQVTQKIKLMAPGLSPIFQALPGFPAAVDQARASVMRAQLDDLSSFQARMSQIRLSPRGQQADMISHLMDDYRTGQPMPATVAHGMLSFFKERGAWPQILELIALLPAETKSQASVVELQNFAKSKSGNHLEAIAALEELIRQFGPTSEREGLLGGRYKRLFNEAAEADKAPYLNNAIKHYELGAMLDLNDYYPASNLPRLYRTRGAKGDAEKALAMAQLTKLSCQRATQRGTTDDWLKPTLLGAAFGAADLDTAERLKDEVIQDGPAAWKLAVMLDDLELDTRCAADEVKKAGLEQILVELKKLL